MESLQMFADYVKDPSKPHQPLLYRVCGANYGKVFEVFLQNPDKLVRVLIQTLSIDKVKNFLDLCGGENVEECHYESREDLESSDLIEIFNKMPKMEQLQIDLSRWKIKISDTEKVLDNSKRLKICDKLNLPSLQTLLVKSKTPSIYEFFTKFLPQNQIVEYRFVSMFEFGGVKEELCEAIEKFYETQKSIKKVEAGTIELLRSLHILTIDDLEIYRSIDKPDEIISALKSQPQLKVLNFQQDYTTREGEGPILKEVCKLSNLEVLKLSLKYSSDFNLIQNLKNLKKLRSYRKFNNFSLSADPQWTSHRFERLEVLELCANLIETTDVLQCFPNLKFLYIRTTLKVNSFAKFLPKVERLELCYNRRCDHELYEADSGIVNESVKSLKIYAEVYNFWDFVGNFSEVCEIFPNLEELKMLADKVEWDFSRELFDVPKFFENFLEFEKLKVLKLGRIPIRFSNFEDIAAQLKKLAQKFEKVLIRFEDKIDFNEDWEHFSYDPLIEALEEDYEVKLKEENDERPEFYLIANEDTPDKRFELIIESKGGEGQFERDGMENDEGIDPDTDEEEDNEEEEGEEENSGEEEEAESELESSDESED